MSEKKHRVFVYGTLKKPFGNHRLLETSEFVGEAYTVDTFQMYCVGFPIIFASDHPDAKAVFGQVYDVDDDTLRNLDSLEAEGRMYDRKKVNVLLTEAGGLIDANVSVYIGNEHYWAERLQEYVEVNTYGELDWRPT